MRIAIIMAGFLCVALAGAVGAQGKSDTVHSPSGMSEKKPGMSCTSLKSGSDAHRDCIAGQAKDGKKSKTDKMDKMGKSMKKPAG